MSTMPISDEPAPAWTERRFVFFRGQFDTKIETGEDYPTQLLAKIFTLVPGDKPKGAGLAMIPSTYCDYDAREHKAQRERGRFIALTGDVDSGDHDLDTIKAAVIEFVDDAAWLIYSSPHSRPGDQRWRIVIPLEDEQPFETWHDAQCSFYAFMEARGIDMDHALARAAQPVYLPNVSAIHAKSETPLRGDDGKPLYYRSVSSGTKAPGLPIDIGPVQFGIAAIRHQRIEDEKTRERIKREAEARRANTPRGDNASLIDDFNAENSVATMLELCGYEQSLRHAEDWRSPHQTGETYATRVMGSKWVSLSASDAAAGVGERCSSGCFGDAYDLFVHYKHGGDHKGAFRALHNERRAAQGNVIYPKQFDAPEWLSEAPAYDQMPEWAEMDPDHEGGVEGGIPSSNPTASESAALIKATPFVWRDPAEIPPRRWLYGRHLIRKFLSLDIAPGGLGKSSVKICEALAMATGRSLLGKEVFEAPLNVWLYNLEDPAEEIERRIHAAASWFDITPEDVGNHLFVDSGREQPICIAEETPDGARIVRPVVDAVIEQLQERAIDVLSIDPFVSSHAITENDNRAIDMVAKEWSRIADICNCAINLVHHVRKTNGQEVTAESSRGAVSLIGAARSVVVYNRMTKEEGERAGIAPQYRGFYFRTQNDKANLAPPEAADWFRMNNVDLPNGDSVGVAAPWKWPDSFEGLTTWHVKEVQRLVDMGQFRKDVRSSEWVGLVIANVCNIDPETDRHRVKDILKKWIETDMLREVERTDEHRRTRVYVEVGTWHTD